MLIETLFQNPMIFVLWVAAVVVALTVHEFSHGFSARLQGDPTAELEGRLTLNPLEHIDWLGFFLLVVAGFGWAKPTPYNPYNLKYKKWGGALVAIAGPISNFAVAALIAIGLVVGVSVLGLDADNYMIIFFTLTFYVNILLGVFNLIPIPPLDGSKILYSFIGDKRPDIVLTMERYGMFMLLALIIFGDVFLWRLISFFMAIYQYVIALVSPETATAILRALSKL